MTQHIKDRRSWSTMPHTRGGIDTKRLTPQFERERDPLHARQLRDADKTEAQRRAAFKAKRTQGHGSQMVKRQRPQPVLKPSPGLAHASDRSNHYDSMADDSRTARRQQRLAEAKAAREVLREHQAWLGKAEERLSQTQTQAMRGDPAGATKELFKLDRELKQRSARVHNRTRTVTRDLPKR